MPEKGVFFFYRAVQKGMGLREIAFGDFRGCLQGILAPYTATEPPFPVSAP